MSDIETNPSSGVAAPSAGSGNPGQEPVVERKSDAARSGVGGDDDVETKCPGCGRDLCSGEMVYECRVCDEECCSACSDTTAKYDVVCDSCLDGGYDDGWTQGRGFSEGAEPGADVIERESESGAGSQNEKVSDGGPLTHELKQDANPPFAAPTG